MEFTFNTETAIEVMEMVEEKGLVEGIDFNFIIGRGDDIPSGIEILSEKAAMDQELADCIQQGREEF